ncbi:MULTISPECIES: hypothetical protein [unclassified Haladaptatus]|uniref:hypothetical protein n=1 Tax=unclassified Haladaptatus TaxID=2622732 RepID=UPI00209BEA90|nr:MULTISPECIES: hypothetical protein [unclassified Haladaptatus]MCO8245175.1 hypothetical protein [Haladaptatus sp. AB643]MCO8253319.1 hypothetical protein [Haladaptatus sp. AB618]
MASTDEELVEELESQRQTIMLDGALRLVEEHHWDTDAGVERELFEEYLDTMTFRYEGFSSSVDEALVSEDSWHGGGHIYELPGNRISYYPPRWHDELSERSDLREYLRVMETDAMETEGGDREAVTDDGVLMDMLLDAAVAIGGMDREDARSQIETLKTDGEVRVYPEQHANPWVQRI